MGVSRVRLAKLCFYQDMNVRISEKDIAPLDRADGAVAMPDGTGFIGTLNVYHELHCVVSLLFSIFSLSINAGKRVGIV